ncbi:hypothetical protein ASF44_21115 [Pseudorhodoferax sp. Leaf274]|nr:hypothetical protein ASF44_21115 [Pseudorhodoferax sp. Leaf274]
MAAPPIPSDRTVLVTGSSGFIGQHLVRALALRGRSVQRAQRPTGDGGIDRLHGIQSIIHLAARAHVLDDTAAAPLAAYRAANTVATLALAEQAAAAGVRRFIFISSVKVHGESTPPGRPFDENITATPHDPYALSKWEAEQGLAAIAARGAMEVVVVRPPLVYGPGVKANFAALLRAVARGWPLPLAAIDNRRSLVGIDNLVDFLLLCLDHPAAANETFLVSDGEDLSTPELLRRLGNAMSRPARLWPIPPELLTAGAALLGRRAAAERLCGNLQVDITKARTLLNWSPPVSVDEGLRRAAAGRAP